MLNISSQLLNFSQQRGQEAEDLNRMFGGTMANGGNFSFGVPPQQAAPQVPVAQPDATLGAQPQGQQAAPPQPPSFQSSLTPRTDAAQRIYNGLIQRGLPPHIAEGSVIAMNDESGLNPLINEKNPLVPGSRGGFGLYQATGPRRIALERYLRRNGVDMNDPLAVENATLDFFVQEGQTSEQGAFSRVMQAQTPEEAAALLTTEFLRPAPGNAARRVSRYLGRPMPGGAGGGGAGVTMSSRGGGDAPMDMRGMLPPEEEETYHNLGQAISALFRGEEPADRGFDLTSALQALSIGLGQMSHGRPVDLSSVFAQQERRREIRQAEAREARQRRAAAEYVAQRGDIEGAQAILGGGVDIGTYLSEQDREFMREYRLREEARTEEGRASMANWAMNTLGYDEASAWAMAENPTAVLTAAEQQRLIDERDAEEARKYADLQDVGDFFMGMEGNPQAQQLGAAIQSGQIGSLDALGQIVDLDQTFQEMQRANRQLEVNEALAGQQIESSQLSNAILQGEYLDERARWQSTADAASSLGMGEDVVQALRDGASVNDVMGLQEQQRLAAETQRIEQERLQAAQGLLEIGRSYPDGNEGRIARLAGTLLAATPGIDAAEAMTQARQMVQENKPEIVQLYEYDQANPDANVLELAAQLRRASAPRTGTTPTWNQQRHPIAGEAMDNYGWVYERDEHGNVIMEEQTYTNQEGETITVVAPRVAQEPDPFNPGNMRYVQSPIGGTPDAVERESEAASAQAAARRDVANIELMSMTIDDALANLDEGFGLLSSSGLAGYLQSFVPGTPGHDLAALLETLEGNLAFQTLGDIKRATGAGLGSVTDAEITLLKASLGSLKNSQSEAQLRRNLMQVHNRLQDSLNPGANYRFDLETGERYVPGSETYGLSRESYEYRRRSPTELRYLQEQWDKVVEQQTAAIQELEETEAEIQALRNELGIQP